MSEEWKAEHDRHYGTAPSPALTREALAAALHATVIGCDSAHLRTLRGHDETWQDHEVDAIDLLAALAKTPPPSSTREEA